MFRGIIFCDFVTNSVRNFFSTDQLTPLSQILSLSWYLLVRLLHFTAKFFLPICLETRSHFESVPKQQISWIKLSSSNHSKLRVPIRKRKSCYPLIWSILNIYIYMYIYIFYQYVLWMISSGMGACKVVSGVIISKEMFWDYGGLKILDGLSTGLRCTLKRSLKTQSSTHHSLRTFSYLWSLH